MTILDVLITDDTGIPASIIKNGGEIPLEIMTPIITTLQELLREKNKSLYVNKFKAGKIDYYIIPLLNGRKYLIVIAENPTKDEEKKIQKTQNIVNKIMSYDELLRKVSDIYSDESTSEKLRKRGISYLDF
ncbi:MAG: hypothetical protein J7L07_02020 [Candidatus Odinarchaeota archaeon]|nr:hypothetical protein [Candidatus Odinarchaeota archaeon]